MNIVLSLSSLGLVLTFSVLMLAMLKLRSWAAYLIAGYLLAYADIVLVLQAAGLANALNRQVVFGLQVLLTGLAASLWLRLGRPKLMKPFSGLSLGKLADDRRSALGVVALGLVACAVAYVYLRQAHLILSVFPNNYDALTYHLSRVGYWLQYQSLYPWPTPNPRQTTWPMNAELGVLWTILWWGTDRLSGFVQWTTVPIIMIAVYGFTRLMGYSRWHGATTALLWATLTQVVYQSSTTQNDLVTAVFWAATVYFFFQGIHSHRALHAALSGLAFGLAIGTKGTSLMVLPGFAAAALAVAVMSYRQYGFRRYLIRWMIACALGFLLFGSYSYVQNIIAFGQPLGPSTARSGAALLQPAGGISIFADRLRDNLGRYAFQFVDFSPLPFDLAARLNPTKAAAFGEVFRWLHIPMANPATIWLGHFDLQYINPLDEDRSWFGPLAILLIPAATVQAYHGARKRDPRQLGLLIMAVGFLVIQSATEPWTPYKGRYYLIPVALSFPLIACLLRTRTVWQTAFAAFIVLLGLAAMCTVAQNSTEHTQTGFRDAFAAERKHVGWPNDFHYVIVRENVPAHASIGLTSGRNFEDYPLFGEHFTRFVTLAFPEEKALHPRGVGGRFEDDFWHSDYLLLSEGEASSFSDVELGGYDLLGDDSFSSLWIRKGLRSADECDTNKWPFRDIFRSSLDNYVCPRFPITAPPSVASDRFEPVIGPGLRRSLNFDLLAKEPARIQFSVRVDPRGYTTEQTLELRLSQAGSEPQLHAVPFSGKSVVLFNVPLQQGIHAVQLSLVGTLDIRVLYIQLIMR